MPELDTSSAIPGLNRDDIYRQLLLLPPLAEQKRVVAKVEELLARVNAAREHLAKVPAILKRFRQSVLAAACSGRLTEEWRGAEGATEWDETTLGEMAELVTSGSRGWAKYYAASGPLFIRAQNLSSDRLDLSDVAYVQLPKRGEGMRTLVAKEDILVTITGANVTKTALVMENIGEAYVNQHVALVRLRESAHAPFVWFWLISPEHGRSQLLDAAYGAGKPGLNLKQIRDVEVRIPSSVEQQEIVRRVDHLLTLADTIEKQVAAGMARVEKLTQAILAKAFCGELVPAEADLARNEGRDYEDGAALLNKVQAVKTEAEIRGKRDSPHRKRTVMKQSTPEMITQALVELGIDTFTFDELRERVGIDYDALRDGVFALLEDPKSGLVQVFDKKTKSMHLRFKEPK